MKNAVRRFQPIEKYLSHAIRMMEREEMLVKMRWEQLPYDPSESDEENSDIQPQASGEEDEEVQSKVEENKLTTEIIVKEKTTSIQPPGIPLYIFPESEGVSEKTIENFLSMNKVLDSPGKQKRSSTIKVLDSDPAERIIWVDRLPTDEYLYQLPETLTLKRQLQALGYLLNCPRPEYYPLLSLVEPPGVVKWPHFQMTEDIQWEILTDEKRDGIEAQRRFVKIALPTELSGSPDFSILEGPPGSGKTTAICELIVQAIRRNMKVLLCASTHIAVDNVLERLQDHNEIIPVRITNFESNVKDTLRPLTLQQWTKSEKKNIVSFLKSLGNQRTESQNFLLQSLEDDDSDNIITKLILDSANLICGTTIGFLRHPDIDTNQPPRPIFDLMILDEASKTTFQEFLVPALFAKRWVLSGDVRQLSPYVEEKEVEGNIEMLLGKDGYRDGDICWKVYQAAQSGDAPNTSNKSWSSSGKTITSIKNRKNLLFIGNEKDPLFQRCEQQCETMGLETTVFTKDNYHSLNSLQALASNAFLVDQSLLPDVEHFLPPDIQIFDVAEEMNMDHFVRRSAYWRNNHNSSKTEIASLKDLQRQRDPSTWAEEMTWRIIRQYELRRTEEEQEHLSTQLDHLSPSWYLEGRVEGFKNGLDNIRRIALPSCLELLQEGFKKTKRDIKYEERSGRPVDYALACGLPKQVFFARHVMLEYQHRMHPDISEFPRENIYADERTNQPVALLDPSYIRRERQWDYQHYPYRRWWHHVRRAPLHQGNRIASHRQKGSYLSSRQNVNHEEADAIMAELDRFCTWTKNHPKVVSQNTDTSQWTVAILTFYRDQERELSHRLRKYFHRPNFRYFNDPKHNTKVEVCTVDRFQGHEADVVFLSFVRNGFSIGFLNSIHRLNVAITRARYLLVIFGDQRSFVKAYEKKKHRSKALYQLAKTTPSDISIGDVA